jgi:hypothetical protein
VKRNRVTDEFEQCYLKQNCAKKAFANQDKINQLLASPDFNRCVKYIANLTFTKNESTLLRHGFDKEDITSVVMTLALQFVNHSFEGKTKKDTYYVLMRFINQRVETFMIFLERKFRIDERFQEESWSEACSNIGTISDMGEDTHEEIISPKIEKIQKSLDKLTYRVMKAELTGNISKYADRLAEIATSKSVDYNVRKKARSICKKNGIDYISWAKTKIEDSHVDPHNFTLR